MRVEQRSSSRLGRGVAVVAAAVPPKTRRAALAAADAARAAPRSASSDTAAYADGAAPTLLRRAAAAALALLVALSPSAGSSAAAVPPPPAQQQQQQQQQQASGAASSQQTLLYEALIERRKGLAEAGISSESGNADGSAGGSAGASGGAAVSALPSPREADALMAFDRDLFTDDGWEGMRRCACKLLPCWAPASSCLAGRLQAAALLGACKLLPCWAPASGSFAGSALMPPSQPTRSPAENPVILTLKQQPQLDKHMKCTHTQAPGLRALRRGPGGGRH